MFLFFFLFFKIFSKVLTDVKQNKKDKVQGSDEIVRTLKPSYAAGLLLYPLRTSENLFFFMFSGGAKRDQPHEID